MTLKNYLIFMSSTTGVCWGAFAFVAGLIDPSKTNWLGFVLFYLSLFLALAGTFALVGFLFRFIVFKGEVAFRAVKLAFHQSFVFSSFVIILLLLASRDLLTWFNSSLLALLFLVFEFFVASRAKKI
ncbi:MAG: hypothetical protein ACOYMB_03220 [Patescibacteria group bacterium]